MQLKQGLLECKSVKGGRGRGDTFGADELFPVLVYVVLQASHSPSLSLSTYYLLSRGDMFGADELFPVLVYVVLQAS